MGVAFERSAPRFVLSAIPSPPSENNMKSERLPLAHMTDMLKGLLTGPLAKREVTELSDDFGKWALEFFKKHRRLPNLREAYEGGKRAAGKEQ
jgi:hypothetical protein